MFFLIDKPLWVSSFFVAKKLRKILNTKKVGYLWTLDPLASWCLLIASDGSTKLLSMLEKSEKTYLYKVDISGRTDSYDLWTPVTPVDTSDFQKRSLEDLRVFLISQVEQIPPRYSAIHINGKRAYHLARSNENFILPSRPIFVSSVDIIDFSFPTITIRMRISSWGYIRSFAPLIGEFFWLNSWYITLLRREKIHLSWYDICIDDAQSLENFSPEKPILYETLFPSIPVKEIWHQEYLDLLLGKNLLIDNKEQYKTWQKIFLRYENIFNSLAVVEWDFFLIERNKV